MPSNNSFFCITSYESLLAEEAGRFKTGSPKHIDTMYLELASQQSIDQVYD